MKSLVIIIYLLVAVTATAATVELGWDANPIEDAVTRYRVYYGNYSDFKGLQQNLCLH